MTSINTNYKASTIDPAAQSGSMDPYLAEVESQIQEALAEIEQFKLESSEWLTEEQLVQMNRIETMLKAEQAAIQGGGLGSSLNPYGVDEDGELINRPEDLNPLWNGIPDDYINTSDPRGQELINDDPAKYGEFAGTIIVPNSGNPMDPTKVAFQMTDEMDAIYAESRGRDIIVTAVDYIYDQDGEIIEEKRTSWVLEEGTVANYPIVFSALGLTHGVTMDFSRVIRTGDANVNGFFIWGTEYNDSIKGTQSRDMIVALDGDDIVNAMGGNDQIWGDQWYPQSGGQTIEYGGDDLLIGGDGDDTVFGGGGVDTGSAADVENGEGVYETEKQPIDDVADASSIPDTTDWFLSPGGDWAVSEEIEDGMVVIENTTGDAGELEIDMPIDKDGNPFTMATATMDNDGNLIITFINEKYTFKVMVEDFFGKFGGDEVVKLTLYGNAENNIIDFSNVTVNDYESYQSGQCIILKDEGGDDIILGAKNALLSDGMDLDELLESQKNSDGELNGYVEEGIFATDSDNYTSDDSALGYSSHVEDGQIVITDDGDPDNNATMLNFKAPDGYEHGYITTDAEGNIYVIMVKPTESGKAETIVIKIDKSLCFPEGELSYDDIGIKHWNMDDDDQTGGSPLPLIAISSDYDDYLIDAGDGNDVVFNQKGGYNENAEDEVWIDPDPIIETTQTTSTSTSEPEPEPEVEEEEEETT